MLADTIAPWIVDAWREAIEALVIDLPALLPGQPYHAAMVLAVAALLGMPIAWFAVSSLPVRGRIVARALVLFVLAGWPAMLAGQLTDPGTGLDGERAALRPEVGATASEPGPTLTRPEIAGTIPPVEVVGATPAFVAAAPAAPSFAQSVPARPETATDPAVQSTREPSSPGPQAAALAKPSAAGTALADLNEMVTRQPAAGDTTEIARLSLLIATDRLRDGFGSIEALGAALPGDVAFGRATVRSQAQARGTTGGAPTDRGTARAVIEQAVALDEATLEADVIRRLATAGRYAGHVLIYVHGFEAGLDTALRQAAELFHGLSFDGVPVLYSWPSAGKARSYLEDARSAVAAAPHLAKLLVRVATIPGVRTVGVVAAGLGARTALMALDDVARNQTVPRGRLGHLLLVAPDIERSALAAQAATLADRIAGLTLYASANDRALDISRRYAGAVPRAGEVTESGPLIAPSVVTLDVSATGTSLGRGAVIEHARAVLLGTSRDDLERHLNRVETERGVYWLTRAAAPH